MSSEFTRRKMLKTIITVGLIICLGVSVSGCDALRTKLADLIAPQSPEDALNSVNTLMAAGHLQEAKVKAEAFADTPGPLQAKFAFAASRVSALSGDTDAALRYLGLAMGPLGLTGDVLITDSAFESMRTDVRFLQLITMQSAPVVVPLQTATTGPPLPSRGVEVNSSGSSTQIKMDHLSTEVRAGDVVIKLPN